MRVIIAGSRTITHPGMVMLAIKESGFLGFITEIVSGGAIGVDRLAENIANYNKIPLKVFPANWDKYGKRAGFVRNAEMADYSDSLIAVWDGTSKGTKNMIDVATEKGLKVFVYKLE